MATKISQLPELPGGLNGEEIAIANRGNKTYKFNILSIKGLITKADVGLGNVNNTSDLNKPVSTAIQSALNSKANIFHNHQVTDIDGLQASIETAIENGNVALLTKADIIHSHDVSDITGLESALVNYVSIGAMEW